MSSGPRWGSAPVVQISTNRRHFVHLERRVKYSPERISRSEIQNRNNNWLSGRCAPLVTFYFFSSLTLVHVKFWFRYLPSVSSMCYGLLGWGSSSRLSFRFFQFFLLGLFDYFFMFGKSDGPISPTPKSAPDSNKSIILLMIETRPMNSEFPFCPFLLPSFLETAFVFAGSINPD